MQRYQQEQLSSSKTLHQEYERQENFIKKNIALSLSTSGEKERLKQLLKQRLMESGWREEVKQYAKQMVREKGRIDDYSTENLLSDITPKARELVPDPTKEEILKQVRNFIEENNFV